MLELKQRVPVEVVWRAFELRPEPVPTLDPGGEYLERVWARSVYPIAASLSIPMRLPPVQPRSRLAHEAAAWARAQGDFERLNAAIFRAFFEDGKDIGSPDVLAGLAREAGLDAAALGRALEAGEHRDAVLSDEARAQDYGIRSVPAFVSGGFALLGLQTADALEELVRRAGGAGEAGTPRTLEYPPIRLRRR